MVIVAAAVDKVRAVADPAVSGQDTNNLEQAGQETSAKGGKQTPTRTSVHVHRMSSDSRIGATAGRIAMTVATPVEHAKCVMQTISQPPRATIPQEATRGMLIGQSYQVRQDALAQL